MKSMTLVARDVGGSKPLGMLTELLRNRNRQVYPFLGNGKPIDGLANLPEAVGSSGVVLCGMSSSQELAQPEIKAMQLAREADTPYAIFADAFDSHSRTWLQEQIAGAAAFFVLNEDEAQKARERFPKLKVVASGNPVWETFAFPEKTDEEVRLSFAVQPSMKMVLVVGTKEPIINIALLAGVLETAAKFGVVRVFFSMHPGDQTPVAFYEPLVSWSGGQIQLVPSNVMTGSDMVVGADLVVDSFSTVAIQAGFLRKPVITYLTELALVRLELITGSREWEPIKRGWVVPVCGGDVKTLDGHFKTLFGDIIQIAGSFVSLKATQRQDFLAPTCPGQSLQMITSTLEALADAH